MNPLQQSLSRCLRSVRVDDDGSVSLEFCYPPEFAGFQGHFPGLPIVPGVCILQSLRLGLEQAWGRRVRVVRLPLVKFVVPVSPGETVLFAIRESARTAEGVTVKARVTRSGQRIAECTVEFEFLPQ